jgi:hypothetical protein
MPCIKHLCNHPVQNKKINNFLILCHYEILGLSVQTLPYKASTHQLSVPLVDLWMENPILW